MLAGHMAASSDDSRALSTNKWVWYSLSRGYDAHLVLRFDAPDRGLGAAQEIDSDAGSVDDRRANLDLLSRGFIDGRGRRCTVNLRASPQQSSLRTSGASAPSGGDNPCSVRVALVRYAAGRELLPADKTMARQPAAAWRS